ncbi:unnamed protein product [Ambrosiozyma monospora]|uniref:Unnamed protein product n=1 Tax=Ambrosiozyma monospora TaxID=43982 RepID=A0A9W6WLL0_AMBMO|nr:unnamed protein product [Ambrosiozyma monospora]
METAKEMQQPHFALQVDSASNSSVDIPPPQQLARKQNSVTSLGSISSAGSLDSKSNSNGNGISRRKLKKPPPPPPRRSSNLNVVLQNNQNNSSELALSRAKIDSDLNNSGYGHSSLSGSRRRY